MFECWFLHTKWERLKFYFIFFLQIFYVFGYVIYSKNMIFFLIILINVYNSVVSQCGGNRKKINFGLIATNAVSAVRRSFWGIKLTEFFIGQWALKMSKYPHFMTFERWLWHHLLFRPAALHLYLKANLKGVVDYDLTFLTWVSV